MAKLIFTFFFLILSIPTLDASNNNDIDTARLKQDGTRIYLELMDSKGITIPVSEFYQNKIRNLLEIDIPGVLFNKPILTLTHSFPGISLFQVKSLSIDPPVIRVSMFLTLQSKAKFHAYLEKDRLYISGKPKKSSEFTLDILKSPVEVEHVDLDFDNTDLMTILNALSIKMGLTLITDSGVKGLVSIHTHNSSLKDILDALLLSRGYKYNLSGNRLTIVSPVRSPFETRLAKELIFKELSLKDALQTMSRMLNINIIIHESVPEKNINFYIENLPLDELFDLLLKTNGLIKKQYNKNTFVVLDGKKSSSFGELVYRTYKLVNTTPEVVQETISNIGELKKIVNTENWSINKDLNQIVVFDTPEAHEIVEKVIASTDERPGQVVIEMKLLEISRNGAKDLGFEMINGLQMNANNTLPKSVDLTAKLSFLERSEKAKVLASPKIRAMHKKAANIHIGEVIPVPYSEFAVGTVTSTGIVAPGTVSQQNQSQAISQEIKRFKDVPVGIQLAVTPEIFRDNQVELDVNIHVDTVLNISSEGQIHKSTKTTTTRIRVKDGETVVFGGLIQQKDSDSSEAPPFLNRLPLISSLFRKRRDIQDSELVLLLTPHIVNRDAKTKATKK
ncbi:hypothetical protein ACFL35_08090 [Candidatus Riflebacteria bacterium]